MSSLDSGRPLLGLRVRWARGAEGRGGRPKRLGWGEHHLEFESEQVEWSKTCPPFFSWLRCLAHGILAP